MQNPRVANRIANFNLFKGNLHVKVVINGNQFYFGKMLMSYMPYTNSPHHLTQDTWLSMIPASQRPHIWIDPTTSQGGELVLPFFYPYDMMTLPLTNPDDLGSMWFKSIVDLHHAQAQSRPLRVTVFAWASDVTLSVPTQSNPVALTAQSGKIDEYDKKPVSKTANAVAAMAGKLSKAPIIGPYAMATQMAASTVGNIASLFGFSRPRQLDSINSKRIWQTGDLAGTDTVDTNDISLNI
jgi:hypothetical protein